MVTIVTTLAKTSVVVTHCLCNVNKVWISYWHVHAPQIPHSANIVYFCIQLDDLNVYFWACLANRIVSFWGEK